MTLYLETSSGPFPPWFGVPINGNGNNIIYMAIRAEGV